MVSVNSRNGYFLILYRGTGNQIADAVHLLMDECDV